MDLDMHNGYLAAGLVWRVVSYSMVLEISKQFTGLDINAIKYETRKSSA
jgi:hypothetical protein